MAGEGHIGLNSFLFHGPIPDRSDWLVETSNRASHLEKQHGAVGHGPLFILGGKNRPQF